MSLPLRYWDTTVFLAWLLPEPDRRVACNQVLRAAHAGELLIVTSALTLTEVIKLKRHPPLTPEHETKIREFFKRDYIVIRNVTRFIAEEARRLIWRHHLDPKDSIHVATALLAHTPNTGHVRQTVDQAERGARTSPNADC